MTDKLLGALGLAKRAGALAVGFDAVCAAAQSGEAALVLLAADASPGTQKRVRQACTNCAVHALAHTKDDIAQITKKPAGVLAVTNRDLAALCLGNLPKAADEEEPD